MHRGHSQQRPGRPAEPAIPVAPLPSPVAHPSGLAAPALLRRAERLGHSWPPHAKASSRPSPAPVQRATLAVETEETDDYETIKGEAKLFHANSGQGVFFDVPGNQTEGATAHETHVDAFGHGNSVSIGDYTPETFADLIAENRETLGLTAVNSVTLHSCEPSTPLSLHGASEALRQKYQAFEGRSFVDRLHEIFFEKYFSYIDVSGYSGETYTDRLGRTRLLKPDKADAAYRHAMDAAKRLDADTDGGTTNQDQIATEYFQPVGAGKELGTSGSSSGFGLEAWAAPPPGITQQFNLELENAEYLTEDDVRTIFNAILKDRWEDRASHGDVEEEEGTVLKDGRLLSGEAVEDRSFRDEDEEPSKSAGVHR